MKFSRIIALALLMTMLLSMFTVTAFASEVVSQIPFSGVEIEFIEESIEKIEANGKITTDPWWVAEYITVDVNEAASYDTLVVVDGMTYGDGVATLIYLKKDTDLLTFRNDLSRVVNIDLSAPGSKIFNIMGEPDKTSTDIGNSDFELDYSGGTSTDTGNSDLDLDDGKVDFELTGDPDSVEIMFSGFIPVLNVILSIITTLITLGMTFFTAFDVSYIAFPVVRNMCDEAVMDNNSKMVKSDPKTGETKLRFVSDDAVYAVKVCSVESGKSPWMLYFRRRLVSYIMLAIILFILLTGNINLITNIVLNAVKGIMEVLQSLGA